MLIEKEIISPGAYWYVDETTSTPRKLDVSPDLTRYWLEQGQAMLSSGLQIPVPYEHDFKAHPMTPKDKLLNNAGEVKEYKLKDFDDPKRGKVKDALFAVVEVQDPAAKEKIGRNIRWSSPWISSFTDGKGKQWNNVITHLALTTRPRITEQAPFPSIAAALSLASPIGWQIMREPNCPSLDVQGTAKEGFSLSRAGRLLTRKKDGLCIPRYPIAFSIMSGAAFGDGDMPPAKKKALPVPAGGKPAPAEPAEDEFEDTGGEDVPRDDDPSNDDTVDLEPFNDPAGDVTMEEVLCDLLGALGVNCEKSGNEQQFKRNLYTAAMSKIHELTSKSQDPNKPQPGSMTKPNQNNPGQPGPAGQTGQPNPLIQQEQQPMYMSIEEIHKITDPVMKSIMLSMHAGLQKSQAEAEANAKLVASLRDAELKKANATRVQRVALLSRISPKIKADLEAMLSNESMALSMGDGGVVVDPMANTLALLEKGLAHIPTLLTTDTSALSVQPHPRDDDEMSTEQAEKLADDMARRMGCAPERKAS